MKHPSLLLFPLLSSAAAAAAAATTTTMTAGEAATKAAYDAYLADFALVLTDPKLHMKHYAEDAVSILNGSDPARPDEVYDPFLSRASRFDFVCEYMFVTDTHVGVKCVDYIEYDTGCSTMFVNHSVIKIRGEDGKIVEYRTFIGADDMGRVLNCLPKKKEDEEEVMVKKKDTVEKEF